MKAIDFVVRTGAGDLQRGTIPVDAQAQTIAAGSGQDISLNVTQSDLQGQVRSGDQLILTLSDGRVLTIDNFFTETGAANRLFISSDGYLNEVAFVEGSDGALYAQYGPTTEWGKWSASDNLIFLGDTDVAGVPLSQGEDVSMLGAALLGGGSLLTGGGAAAAGLAGAALVGGIGGSSSASDGPFVNDAGDSRQIGGDDAERVLTITGGGTPGDRVTIAIGDRTIDTEIGEDGRFDATFEGDDFPADGRYPATVTITDPDGATTDLDGPDFIIDTTGPEVTITAGARSTGDVFNETGVADGVRLSGTGEPGATLEVTISGRTESTIVGTSGGWSVHWAPGSFEAGEYTSEVSLLARDNFGNTTGLSDAIVVDTLTTVTLDSPVIAGDGVLNGEEHAAGVVFSGTAEAGATVEITVGNVTRTVIGSDTGVWAAAFSAAEIETGDYIGVVSVIATDRYGNTATAADSFDVDTLVRNLAITSDPGGADGVVNAAEFGQPLTVTGTSEPGSTVEVTLGGETVVATVTADGNWSADFTAAALEAGTYAHQISVTATDAAGNRQTITGDLDVDTEVTPFAMTSTAGGADGVLNAAEAATGIDLAGQVEPGSAVNVRFDGKSYAASVDVNGAWALTIPAADVRGGTYAADLAVTATDRVGNTATIADTLSIDTDAPDGPVIASFTRDGDGIRGISVETVMEDGAPTGDTQSVVQVAADGTITGVAGAQGFNILRGETDFAFDDNVPNGSQLIVNATDAAGNTAGTYLVLDDESATNTVDLSSLALGDYQIENLDLDFAEAAAVTIDEASLLALSTETNTLTVHGSAEDRVTIEAATLQGTQDVGGRAFNVYSVGAEGTLLIDPDIPVTI